MYHYQIINFISMIYNSIVIEYIIELLFLLS